MVAGAFVIVDRHAHEGRHDALLVGQLLHQRLEQEGAIGGRDCFTMREVDLVLGVAVLLRHRDRLEPERVAGVEHRPHDAGRIGERPDGVDARVAHRQRAQAADTGVTALKEVELELMGDDRREAERAVACGDALERPAGIEARRLVRRHRLQVAEDDRDRRIERIDARRLEIWHRDEVAEARFVAADDVVPMVDRHDRLDEGLAVADRVRRAAEQDVLAALDAVEIAVDEAQDAHALGLKLLNGHLPPSQSV